MRPGESVEGSRSARGRCIDANIVTNSGTERLLAHPSSATRRMKRGTTKRRMRGISKGMTDGGMTVMRCFLWSLVFCSLSSRAQGNVDATRARTHTFTLTRSDINALTYVRTFTVWLRPGSFCSFSTAVMREAPLLLVRARVSVRCQRVCARGMGGVRVCACACARLAVWCVAEQSREIEIGLQGGWRGRRKKAQDRQQPLCLFLHFLLASVSPSLGPSLSISLSPSLSSSSSSIQPLSW